MHIASCDCAVCFTLKQLKQKALLKIDMSFVQVPVSQLSAVNIVMAQRYSK